MDWNLQSELWVCSQSHPIFKVLFYIPTIGLPWLISSSFFSKFENNQFSHTIEKVGFCWWIYDGFFSRFMMIFAESRLGWLNTAGKNPEKFREDVFHASRCATPNFCWSSATCAWQKKSSKDLKTAEENDALWESRKDNSCQTSELKTGKNMLKHHICSKICFLKIVLRSSLLWIGIKTCLFAEELPFA